MDRVMLFAFIALSTCCGIIGAAVTTVGIQQSMFLMPMETMQMYFVSITMHVIIASAGLTTMAFMVCRARMEG